MCVCEETGNVHREAHLLLVGVIRAYGVDRLGGVYILQGRVYRPNCSPRALPYKAVCIMNRHGVFTEPSRVRSRTPLEVAQMYGPHL